MMYVVPSQVIVPNAPLLSKRTGFLFYLLWNVIMGAL